MDENRLMKLAGLLNSPKPKPTFGLLGLGQGPYAPMGRGMNIGTTVDTSRQKLNNSDGTFSTERTVTLPLNGKWYNVPTIVNGQRYSPQEIEQYFGMGLLPHVGEFQTVEQAVRSAKARSNYIGRIRE